MDDIADAAVASGAGRGTGPVEAALPIDFSPMFDAVYGDGPGGVVDLIEDAIVTNAESVALSPGQFDGLVRAGIL